MIDRIPLGGAAGVVTDGDLEAMRVDEACLEGMLEAANARRVAAAGVSEQQQFAGVGVVQESFGLPPAQQVVSGEIGGVVRGADDHEAAVGGKVVDAVGDGDGVGLGAEVVVVDGKRGSFPSRAVVLEMPNSAFQE